jgi:hypothetical protein
VRCIARISLRFPRMSAGGQALSRAGSVRRAIHEGGPSRWWRGRDFSASTRSVETELSRLASAGELIRVRKGLYWRGEGTRFGMIPPSPLAIGLEIAGRGAGPAGVAAAAYLGLTTQVPSVVEIAVPGRCPSAIAGVRFRQRPIERRERQLEPREVAVLEVLRDPSAVETPWDEVVLRVRADLRTRDVRRDVLEAQLADESHVALRERWAHVISG